MTDMNKIGIIGGKGFVGRAMQKLFPNALVFGRDAKQEDIDSCDAIFVSVPTDLKEMGQVLDTSIVEDVVSKCNSSLIIIRSTLNPGTCDYLEEKYKKNIVMMPEYVGETIAHPLLEEAKRPFLIIGGNDKNRRKAIELLHTVYNANVTIRQVSNYQAEVIKLMENRAIAFKQMQCQEAFDILEKAKKLGKQVDYYETIQAVYGDDPRFNLWFTAVYPDKRGFNNSKCLRKDVPAFAMWAESIGVSPKLTWALIRRSNDYETYGE